MSLTGSNCREQTRNLTWCNHPTKNLPGLALPLEQRRHSQSLILKDGGMWMKTRQSIQPLCFYYRQMRERQDFGQLLCSQGQSKLQRTRCMPELILCCLSLTFVTVQSSSRYRSTEWPSALMIRLSGSYLGKHWRTLGNCFYDSGSPLWAAPSGKQQSSQRARTCKSFQTWPFPFSPTAHKISSEKFKKVHKA